MSGRGRNNRSGRYGGRGRGNGKRNGKPSKSSSTLYKEMKFTLHTGQGTKTTPYATVKETIIRRFQKKGRGGRSRCSRVPQENAED